MIGVPVDEYIPLEARVNPNGSVDVLVDGETVPGGSGLAMPAVLQLLTRYAAENGKLLMTTTHPDGSVTRDLVSETGEVTPFYPEVTPSAKTVAAASDPSEEALLQVLKQSSRRRVGYSEIAAAPVAPAAPTRTRVKMGEGAIPKYDVEADIQKTLASKKHPPSTKKSLIIAVILTVLVLAVIALVGMPLISAATHLLGALPAPGPIAAPLQL